MSKPEGVEFTISGSAGESIDGVDVVAISPSTISLLSILVLSFSLSASAVFSKALSSCFASISDLLLSSSVKNFS